MFPKCYFDELVRGERSYVGWIHDAATLGGEGVEHYDEFFPSYDERDVAPVMDAMRETGQVSSMLCFSPTSRIRTPTNGRGRWNGRSARSICRSESAPVIAGR